MRTAAALALAVAVCAGSQRASGPALTAALAEADALYARRAQGAQDGVARPGDVAPALAAYRAALAGDPDSAEARFRLVRALHFRGTYCGAARAEQVQLLAEARDAGEDGVKRLEARVRGRPPRERITALREVPAAARLYVWTAAAWGEWALVRGKWAAARSGAAGRIRDLAQTAVDLDPAAEEAGGLRVLGRVHAEAPRIPLVTGWVSRRAAIAHLRRALALAPQNLVNRCFLGEALLDHGDREEGRRLLEECASMPPRPVVVLEEGHFAALARRRLAGR